MPISEAVRASICEQLADGKSLREICRQDGMPFKTQVFREIEADDDFRVQYIRARECQADTFADDLVNIADDKTDDPNSRRVRLDARKWAAGKIAPKKYGDKIEHEHTATGLIEALQALRGGS